MIFEGLYLSNNIVSLKTKVHEVYVKEIPQRKSLMTIEEDEEDEDLKPDENEENEEVLKAEDLLPEEKSNW